MSEENELCAWWDGLTPEHRIATAKELKLWNPEDDWSVAWSELRSSLMRRNLGKALQSALPLNS